MTRLGALVYCGQRAGVSPAGARQAPGTAASSAAFPAATSASAVLRLCVIAACAMVLGCDRHTTERREITVWAMGREGEMVERLLPAFARRVPGLRVRVQQIPWSAAHEKLLTAFVGDAMPDVFQLGSTWVPELAALGALAPLDAQMAGSPAAHPDDFFPGILDANRIEGTTYGLPWYVDTRLLFYRTDLLAQAGVARAPADWAAWLGAMTAVQRAAGPGRYAILLPLNEWQPPVILAMQRGATLLRDGDRYGDFQSAAFRDAFAFYLELFRRGLAPASAGGQVANLYQDFTAGFFAFYISGPWNVGEFRERLPESMRDRWTTAPMPAPVPGPPGISLAGGASLALSPTARDPDAAWQLMEYLAEPATQLALYRLTGDLPARRAAWGDPALRDDPVVQPFWEQLQYVRAPPKIPEWERIAAKITDYAEAAVRGDLSAEAALAALDRDVDALLEKRRWMLEHRDG